MLIAGIISLIFYIISNALSIKIANLHSSECSGTRLSTFCLLFNKSLIFGDYLRKT